MAQYPRQQAQVAALTGIIIAGFREHPVDFPHGDPALLETSLAEFVTAGNELVEANAKVAHAAKAKKEKFAQLQTTMKQQIKQAQVDCAKNPVKLSAIGWGPRREAEDVDLPGQPMGLRATEQSSDSITLHWQKPARDSRAPVNCYLIHRRGGEQSNWQLAGTALDNKISLTDQPTGTRLEYRVLALNKAGESMPSNTIAVVL